MNARDEDCRVNSEPATDRFFDHHLVGVIARLEAQTSKALERQRLAWRDTVRREALLEEKEFEQTARH